MDSLFRSALSRIIDIVTELKCELRLGPLEPEEPMYVPFKDSRRCGRITINLKTIQRTLNLTKENQTEIIDSFLLNYKDPLSLETAFFKLTHEVGHAVSRNREEDPENYEEIVAKMKTKSTITSEEHQTVLNEERRAWANGRELLASLGWENLARFDSLAHESMQSYTRAID